MRPIWKEDGDAQRVASAMLVALVLGCAIAAIAAWSAWASALLWAGACSAVGWFLGFLFGIPRSLSSDAQNALAVKQSPAVQKQEEQSADAQKAVAAKALQPVDAANPDPNAVDTTAADSGAEAQPAAHAGAVAVNTNLEQISDWLTKIIVGVTLVEINAAITRLEQTAKLIAGSLGGDSQLSVAYGLMVYFSVSGFLGSYLLTRLFLQGAFRRVEDTH